MAFTGAIACYLKIMYEEFKEVNAWNMPVWSIIMKFL